ncbi:hypothetical protein E4T56_gene666 [Termitomyces sp. T112]|nr:hypothetical protein E4T56_gene666 [Termitomyces sp. T112]
MEGHSLGLGQQVPEHIPPPEEGLHCQVPLTMGAQYTDPQDAGSESGISRAWESKLINIDQTAASGGGMGKEVEGWMHPGVSQLVVMSSSAYSPTASRSPSPPSQPSSSEDSEGCQDRCRVEVMYRSHEGGLSHISQNIDWSFTELSTAVAGPSGPSSGTDMMQPPVGMAPSMCSKSGICPGVVRLVLEGLRVVQAEVMLEQFAKVVGWARGPPTLEWCQVAALCEFEAPASGVRQDTLVCLLCRLQHEKCSVTLSWHAACIVAEQEWDRDWVAAQLEEGQKGRVSGRGSGAGEGEQVSVPTMKVGPLWGGWREGAPSMQEKGKWRVSPSSEAGPSKQARGEQVMGGPPGSVSVVEAFLQCRVESLEWLLVAREEEVQGVWEERDGARRELDRVRREWDLVRRDKDIAMGTAVEQLSCLQELEVWTVHLQVRAEVAEVATQQAGGSGVWENQQGSSAGGVQAAAGGMACQQGGLGPVRSALEHRILLDRASAVLGSIHDGLVRMPGDLPLELGQGVMQMGRLLAGHRRRVTADPGAWWEMATDVKEPLPRQPKVLAMVVAQLKVFIVGRVVGLGLEEE